MTAGTLRLFERTGHRVSELFIFGRSMIGSQKRRTTRRADIRRPGNATDNSCCDQSSPLHFGTPHRSASSHLGARLSSRRNFVNDRVFDRHFETKIQHCATPGMICFCEPSPNPPRSAPASPRPRAPAASMPLPRRRTPPRPAPAPAPPARGPDDLAANPAAGRGRSRCAAERRRQRGLVELPPRRSSCHDLFRPQAEIERVENTRMADGSRPHRRRERRKQRIRAREPFRFAGQPPSRTRADR